MLTIETPSFNDLTDDEKESVPNNGNGKEYANYIKVTHNGNLLLLESDAMEPEDCVFYRDLSWVAPALKDMYEIGRADALSGDGA